MRLYTLFSLSANTDFLSLRSINLTCHCGDEKGKEGLQLPQSVAVHQQKGKGVHDGYQYP